jgi:hypothetical protein
MPRAHIIQGNVQTVTQPPVLGQMLVLITADIAIAWHVMRAAHQQTTMPVNARTATTQIAGEEHPSITQVTLIAYPVTRKTDRGNITVVSAQNVITLADGEMLMMIETYGLFPLMHCFTSNDHFAISLTR